MLKSYAAQFVAFAGTIREFEELLNEASTLDQKPSPTAVKRAGRLFKSLMEMEDTFPLPMVIAQIKRVNDVLDGGENQMAVVKAELRAVRNRLEDELRSHRFLYVPPARTSFYDSSFGEDVASIFPECSFDLDEAGKCISLSRYTAAVFHVSRALESAVRTLGRTAGVTIVDKNDKDLTWGVIIANLQAHIEAMPAGARRAEWSNALTMLYHAKEAWRNSTMHPKQTYTEEEAIAVFNAVGAFLRSLVPLL